MPNLINLFNSLTEDERTRRILLYTVGDGKNIRRNIFLYTLQCITNSKGERDSLSTTTSTSKEDRASSLGASSLGASSLGASSLGASSLGASSLGASSLGASSLGASSLGASSLGASSLGASSLGASSLGWIVEILQAYFLISDDMADRSSLRRGNPCWYKKHPQRALKDCNLLHHLIIKNTKKEIRKEFIDTMFRTMIGQSLDTYSINEEDGNLTSMYTNNIYKEITRLKTSYYSLLLPIRLAYLFTNQVTPASLESFCFRLGFSFQVRDDYLNFMPEVSKKTGNDLEEKKKTWFLCKIAEEGHDSDFKNYLKTGDVRLVEERVMEEVRKYDDEGFKRRLEEEAKKEEGPILKVYSYCISLIYQTK